jgi:hypothetical protein
VTIFPEIPLFFSFSKNTLLAIKNSVFNFKTLKC